MSDFKTAALAACDEQNLPFAVERWIAAGGEPVMRDGKLVALLREGKYAGMTYAEQARTYQGFVRAHNEAWKGGGRPTDLQEVEKEDFLLQTGFDPEMHEVMCVEAAAERSDRSWYSSPYGD